ncbi:5-methylcytosine-specific restriction enzyme A [Sphingobium faniae]|nr:5-methylcytosine-specific restriction enzyme A [Sphingobium faniae]
MAQWPYNTTTWRDLRFAHLALFPACKGCEAMGRLTRANTVDHIVPISEGGAAFPGHDGLRSYCQACHSAKTARGTEAGAIRSTKPRKGCDVDGWPLDPAHPWNSEKSLRADDPRPTPNLHNQLVSKDNL